MSTAEIVPHQDFTPSSPKRHDHLPRSESPRRNLRHTKGLSLNFPILLPPHQSSQSSSPRAASPVNSPPRGSPHMKADSFPTQPAAQSPSKTGAEILTLVATQERRVLELREELAKAETELTGLKKQWALYEANKKRDEVRQARKMAVPFNEVPSPKHSNEDELEEERIRGRTLLEMSNNTIHQTSAATGGKMGRKGSQRVFEGGHTRALSLLSPTSQKQSHAMTGTSIDELLETAGSRSSEEAQPAQTPKANLSRMPTLDGFVSPDSLQQSFGKTYKDLASHRNSLPPVSTDIFMKSSKQVVDGVREGLWTFFEDIRQATVGDEAINGPAMQQKQRRHSKDPTKPLRSKSKTSHSTMHDVGKSKDASFWREFGLDTPGKQPASPPKDSRNGHGQQKIKDSQDPSDLLGDINDYDDDWENWESPISTKTDAKPASIPAQSGERLPWPELKKMTPSKLNRTASDMMRQMDGDTGKQQQHVVDAASRERPNAQVDHGKI